MRRRIERSRTRASTGDGALIQQVAPGLVRDAYATAMKSADQAVAKPTPTRVHTLRKKLKNLRYTLEFVSGAYEPVAEPPIKQLQGLQDLLGSRQDALSFKALFQELAGNKALTKDARSMARRWAAEEDARAASLTVRIPETVSDLKGPAWVRLWQEMEKKCVVPAAP